MWYIFYIPYKLLKFGCYQFWKIKIYYILCLYNFINSSYIVITTYVYTNMWQDIIKEKIFYTFKKFTHVNV